MRPYPQFNADARRLANSLGIERELAQGMPAC